VAEVEPAAAAGRQITPRRKEEGEAGNDRSGSPVRSFELRSCGFSPSSRARHAVILATHRIKDASARYD
jgi:hypothetical protein